MSDQRCNTITTADLAAVFKVSPRAIRKRSEAQGWPEPITRAKKGGNVYSPDSLPLTASERKRVARYLRGRQELDQMEASIQGVEAAAALPTIPPATTQGNQETPPVAGPMLPTPYTPPSSNEAIRTKALAKYDLLRLYNQAINEAPWGQQVAARDEFVVAYNSGQAWPKLHAIIGPIASWKTIENWKLKLRRRPGPAMDALADCRGYARNGRCSIDEETHGRALLSFALRPNGPRKSEAIRMTRATLRAKGIDCPAHDATLRRWLDRWISRNYGLWVMTREGQQAFDQECSFYIERDYSLIEVGDILVADGHTLNFEILNPWTGKPKRMTLILWLDMKSTAPLGWEIMPTEDTRAIAAAFRRAVIHLGKIPKVAYLDNGRAFRARFFKNSTFDEAGFAGLYERLGVKTIHAWPYHGQSKSVERFFGTFAELERWCPSYTGTSIEHKPPRMNRGEKLHRRLYEKFSGGPITLEQAHRAIAAWFEVYMERPSRAKGLNGRTPAEVFEAGRGPGVDIAALNYLMMSVEVKTPHRNGISFRGRNYYHPALADLRHRVIVRYDIQDLSALHVYDEHENPICTATPVEMTHPAAGVLGTEQDQAVLAGQLEIKKGQEKRAAGTIRDLLELEVLPEHQRQLTQIGGEAALPAGLGKNGSTSKVVSLDYEKAVRDAQGQIAAQQEFEARDLLARLGAMDESDRYEHLLEMVAKGEELPPGQAEWMSYFEASTAYTDHPEYWEQRQFALALMYGHRSEAAGELPGHE